MEKRVSQFKRFISGCSHFAGIVIFAMAFFVTFEVFSRYLFESPTKWVNELSTFMVVVAIYLALSGAELMGEHIRVDLLVDRLNETAQGILQFIVRLATLFFLFYLTWGTIRHVIDSLVYSEVTVTMKWPFFPVKVICAIGLILFSLQLIVNMVEGFTKLIRRVHPPTS